jgi:hypothetical protein
MVNETQDIIHNQEKTQTSSNLEILPKDYEISPSEVDTSILKGGMEILEHNKGGLTDITEEYKINWLVTSDEELVGKEKIIERVKEYITNYKSVEFEQYKQDFKKLYQKYSNKRHIINETEDTIVVVKNTEKQEVVMKLAKPRYIFYNNNEKLFHMKRDISNERKILKLEYDKLSSRVDVMLEERKDFEKQRKKFIDLLERYYIFTLYHTKINNINEQNKQKILIQDTILVTKGDDEHKILNGELYLIDNTVIDQINTVNAAKLDEYNTLVSKMQSVKDISKDKEIITKIKDYLKREQNIELNNQLKTLKKEQDIVINFIVSKLPSTETETEKDEE